jgi:hypothetical protein
MKDIPLSVRILERFPSPLFAALLAGLLLTSVYLLGEWFTGGLQGVWSGAGDSLGLRATATLFLLVAYIPLAHLLLRRWTGQHLSSLSAASGSVTRFTQSSPPSVLAGILGMVTFLLLFIVVPNFLAGFPGVNFQMLAAAGSGMVFGWLSARFLVCMVMDSMRMSQLARDLHSLDLLDLDPLVPFVQQGLKSVLLTVIVMVLTSHLYIAPGDAVIGSSVFLLIWGGLTLLVYILPVRGIHERIQREKRSQLAAVRAEIRDAASQVLENHEGAAVNGRLSALLDLEIRLERVRAWPFDGSSWLKFGLYLLLGLGSWLGAAAVERLLDTLL